MGLQSLTCLRPNILGSYAILFFKAYDFTYITTDIHNWALFLLWLHLFILSFSFIHSPLFSSSILGIYLPGEFIFQCHIFLPFKLFKARTLKWLAIPFSSVTRFVRTIHHDQSVLGALPGVAHSSVELDKAVIHVMTLVSFLFLLFSFYLPSGDGVEGHMLIFCENSKTTTRC